MENSSLSFAFFFLAEYLNIILMSVIIVILFMGGWGIIEKGNTVLGEIGTMVVSSVLYGLKISIILYIFVWVRATYPRYRYDQLMAIAWKSQLPISIGIIILIPSLIVALVL